MAAHLGAHEVMEMHEVMNNAINCLNQFQLYRSFAKDPQLQQIMDRQLQFAINEYNAMVNMAQQKGGGQAVPYRSPKQITPVYGLDNPGTQAPNMSVHQMDDRDVASGMLSSHKSSALFKMIAALECADPQLRSMLQQGAVNCSEQAYEIWQYMNQKGYYQVPTMKEMTTNTVMNSYQQAGNMGRMPASQQDSMLGYNQPQADTLNHMAGQHQTGAMERTRGQHQTGAASYLSQQQGGAIMASQHQSGSMQTAGQHQTGSANAASGQHQSASMTASLSNQQAGGTPDSASRQRSDEESMPAEPGFPQ
ncbi:spore coat protein [Xylanibacillus composti]|uniref:Spore coat protein n=1 Tax=Xylanibacillus composti TaxID=1572762 RepID=A0A8J4GZ11_9BACL|nr:spore coat protein [Xylanibacillus composti]MDT9725673.1 spore coat protein [Xylanibacillus composti]GIQ67769.1 hypothetical protein XYCOK13_05930 [Xylanibacillus composti]